MRQSLSVSLLRKISAKIFSVSTALLLVSMSVSGVAPFIISQAAFAENTPPTSMPTVTTPSSAVAVTASTYTIHGTVQDDSDTTVTIYKDANNNGSIDSPDDTIVASGLANSDKTYALTVSLSIGQNNFLVTAIKKNHSQSSAVDVPTITSDVTAPSMPSATPTGGSYNTAQTVTLSSSDSGSGLKAIYYTTDGSTPTTSSAQYSTPITVASSKTIKAIAYDNAGNASSVATFSYVIDATAPAVPTLTGPTNNGYYNNQTNDFNFTWTAVSDPSAPVTYDWESSYGNSTNADGSFTNQLAFHQDMTATTLAEGNSSEGTYYWHVRACDALGNCSAWATPWKVTIDNTAPTVSVTPVATSVLHGTATFDITVNDQNPTNTLNNKIWVYLYNTASPYKSYGANVDLSSGTGTFTVDTSLLNDGDTSLDVGALRDAAGNWTNGGSDSYFSHYAIDNAAPAGLANLTPANGTFTTTSKLTTIDWTDASDAHGPVTYYYESSTSSATNADGSFVSPAYQSGALSTSQISTSGTPEGTYYWHVRAVDALGNSTSWTDAWKVVVDNTAPVITVSPAAGSLLHGTATFDITVTDNNTLDPSLNTSVWVYLYDVAGVQKHSGAKVDLSSGHGTFTVDTTLLDDGKANLDVGIVTDAAGNASGVIDNYFEGYVIDNTAPVVSLSSPADGSYLQGSKDMYGSVQDDNLLGYALVLVNGDINPTDANDLLTSIASGQLLSGPDFTNVSFQNQNLGTLDTANYSDGQYTLVLLAADQTLDPLNVGWALSHFTIDNTPPTAPALVAPESGSRIPTNDFYFSWNASTDASPLTYEFIASQSSHATNGVLDTGVWDNIANGNNEQKNLTTPTIHSTGAPDGTWYWQVRAIDAAGNKSDWSEIWNTTIDTQAPAVPSAALADANNGSVTNNGYITTKHFTFHLSDGSPDVTRYQLKYWNGIANSAFNGENNAWNPTDLSGYSSSLGVYNDQFTQGEGTHYFAFSACDAAGNCSDYSAPFTVTYDATTPTTPSPSVKAATYTAAQHVELTSSDNGSGLAGIYYTTDGSTPSKTNGTLYTSALTVSSSETVKAIAYDNAGNASDVMVAAYVINHPAAPQVLGASTDNTSQPGSDNEGHVLGDATTTTTGSSPDSTNQSNNSAPTDNTSNKKAAVTKSGAFLGLGWWWLAILVLLLILFLFILGRRSDSDEKA